MRLFSQAICTHIGSINNEQHAPCERPSLCLRAILTVSCERFPIVFKFGAADPSCGWDGWVFLFFSPSLLFPPAFWIDLTSSHPTGLSPPPSSNSQPLVKFCRDLFRFVESVSTDLVLPLDRVFLTPPPSLCGLPLLVVLLVDFHALLSLCCRFFRICDLLGLKIGILVVACNWLLCGCL